MYFDDWSFRVLIQIMRTLKTIAIVTVSTVGIYLLSGYINSRQIASYEEMLDFISTCGTLIEAGFKSTKRGQADYAIVLISAVIVILTLFYSIKFLVRPGENYRDHIKYRVLENGSNAEKGKSLS